MQADMDGPADQPERIRVDGACDREFVGIGTLWEAGTPPRPNFRTNERRRKLR